MARNGAGALREVIVLQKPDYGDDAAGGHPISWSDVATIRGQVAPTTGREETVTAQKLESRQLYLVTIRRRTDVSAASRLKVTTMGDLLLNVRAANPVPLGEPMQEMLCEAGTAQ